MQTDNKTIESEELEYKAFSATIKSMCSETFEDTPCSNGMTLFEAGATWQQAQYIPLIESHLELFKCGWNALQTLIAMAERDKTIAPTTIKELQQAIEKANKLIQTT